MAIPPYSYNMSKYIRNIHEELSRPHGFSDWGVKSPAFKAGDFFEVHFLRISWGFLTLKNEKLGIFGERRGKAGDFSALKKLGKIRILYGKNPQLSILLP